MLKTVAIIGCGAIGSVLAKAIDNGTVDAKLLAVYDIVEDKSYKLVSELKHKPKIVKSIDEMINLKPDIIVEAASQQAVRDYATKILRNRINLMIMSVGALLNKELLSEILEVAKEKGVCIYIPSGAIAGLDAIEALKLVGIKKIVLRTRKPPKALKEAEYLRKRGIDLEKVSHEVLVFKDKASEAVKAFPVNINISAALTLASNTEVDVEIVADPNLSRNIHEIEVYSEASRIVIRVENIPTPKNPRTSYLATLSAIYTLKKVCESTGIRIL